MESKSWPLLSPALPPPAAAAGPGRDTAQSVVDGKTGKADDEMENTNRARRLSGPSKDASEDYHDFIECVEKSSKATGYSEQKRKRRRAQRFPVGTTRLFDHRRLRLVPFPSANPKDPLNLPTWRKWAAIGAMSLFGALAVATESAIGNLLLPVFELEYAGVDPHNISQADFVSASTVFTAVNLDSPIAALLPTGSTLPSPKMISLLATLPLLTAAAASYVHVPLSEAVGRRPVLLLASLCAWVGALWAGLSSSSFESSSLNGSTSRGMVSPFTQHLAARALIGVGAGAVNALVPLVAAHDLVFLHQRHLVLAVVVASQAVVTAAFSAAAPYLAALYDWRWLYFIAGTAGFLAWLALVAFVPETRWTLRTATQICGGGGGCGDPELCVYADDHAALRAGRVGNDDDNDDDDNFDAGASPSPSPRRGLYGERTLWTDVGLFVVSPFGAWQWRRAGRCALNLLRTALLPAVLWVALLNGILLVAQQAMTQLTVAAMLSQGWPFALTGVGLAASLGGAGVLAVVFGGVVAGPFTLAVTRHLRAQQHRRNSLLPLADRRNPLLRKPTVRREAEHNLPVLAFPLVLAIAGCFFFGAAGQSETVRWPVLAAASFLASLALLLVLAAGSVFLVESYPIWAGPCLVHANSLRFVAAFFLAGRTTTSLVADRGFLEAWAVYAELLIVASLGLPALFFAGRWLRAWAAGTVQVEEGQTVRTGGERREMAVVMKKKAAAGAGAKSVSPTPSDSSASSSSTSSSSDYTMTSAAGSPPLPQQQQQQRAPRAQPRVSRVHFQQDSVSDESSITGRAL